jgi:hypothetical protein
MKIPSVETDIIDRGYTAADRATSFSRQVKPRCGQMHFYSSGVKTKI